MAEKGVNHVWRYLDFGCNWNIDIVGVGMNKDSKYLIAYRCLNCGALLGQIDVGEPTPVLYPSARVEWVDGVGRCKLDCGTEGCNGRQWEPIPKRKKGNLKR